MGGSLFSPAQTGYRVAPSITRRIAATTLSGRSSCTECEGVGPEIFLVIVWIPKVLDEGAARESCSECYATRGGSKLLNAPPFSKSESASHSLRSRDGGVKPDFLDRQTSFRFEL